MTQIVGYWNPYLLKSLIVLLVLAVISVSVTKSLVNRWVSAASVYWSAWIFLVISTVVCDFYGWNYKTTTEFACNYIIESNKGAFLGFTLGSVFIFLIKRSRRKIFTKNQKKLLDKSEKLIHIASSNFLWLVFLTGLFELIIKIYKVGLNAATLTNLRFAHLQREFSIISWFATHLSSVTMALIVLAGALGALRGFDFKKVMIFSIASAPLGLAKASRIFLLSFFLTYSFSLLSMRSSVPSYIQENRVIRKDLFKTLSFSTIGLAIFSFLGFQRSSIDIIFNPVQLILGWPASSAAALDSWISQALVSPRSYGINTFIWPASLLDKIGLLDISAHRETMEKSLLFFLTTHDSAAVIPRTIIPDLIYDFGPDGVFWGMAILTFFLQLASILFSGKGIFRQTLAAMSLQASFMTIQGSLFSPEICIVIFWGLVLSKFYNNFAVQEKSIFMGDMAIKNSNSHFFITK